MTDRQTLYTGVSRAAWGYFFLYFDFNLGPVSVLPDFVSMLMFLSAISLLKNERRDLILLRPLGIMLTLWHVATWALSWFGASLEGRFEILELLITTANLYFHFQMFTDFAALAAKYQQPEDPIDRRLLRWRTVQTVLLTALVLISHPILQQLEWWSYITAGMTVLAMIACLCLMAALFALRKIFRGERGNRMMGPMIS